MDIPHGALVSTRKVATIIATYVMAGPESTLQKLQEIPGFKLFHCPNQISEERLIDLICFSDMDGIFENSLRDVNFANKTTWKVSRIGSAESSYGPLFVGHIQRRDGVVRGMDPAYPVEQTCLNSARWQLALSADDPEIGAKSESWREVEEAKHSMDPREAWDAFVLGLDDACIETVQGQRGGIPCFSDKVQRIPQTNSVL